MGEVAHHSGSYTWPVDGRSYPKVQLMTVEQRPRDSRSIRPMQGADR
jgi:hypothetical protein